MKPNNSSSYIVLPKKHTISASMAAFWASKISCIFCFFMCCISLSLAFSLLDTSFAAASSSCKNPSKQFKLTTHHTKMPSYSKSNQTTDSKWEPVTLQNKFPSLHEMNSTVNITRPSAINMHRNTKFIARCKQIQKQWIALLYINRNFFSSSKVIQHTLQHYKSIPHGNAH